jgi:putative pyruvate formate lyase activating enzyme
VKRAIARHLYRGCVLCEHRCGVDREAGARGVCRVGPTSYFAAGFVHLAEEREIAPSFCLTLTGCSWHCVYCHTYDIINRVDHGTPLEAPAYADLHARIGAPDVRTLSFVGGNPDHHVPAILDFLAAAPAGFDRPIVWNSNMYGSPELYRLLDGVVDVYLGDVRYGNDACAARLSGLPRCVAPVARNWALADAQGAELLARVLLLPGHLDCCLRPIVAWLAAELPRARVSLLDQFHPAYLVAKRAPELDRTPTAEEVEAARRCIADAGLRTVAPPEG